MAQKWEEKRTENSQPCAGRRSYEKIDLTSYRKEEDFAEIWQEGDCLTLDAFLTSRGFCPDDFSSLQQKKKFIEQDCVCTLLMVVASCKLVVSCK